MERYIRFGEIPQKGQSVNFIKLNYKEREDFSWYLEHNRIKEAYENVPQKAFEKGISVFEMDKNGMPIINNIELAKDLAGRMDDKINIYEVTGIIVGTGDNKEPLLSDIKVVKKRRIKKEKIIKHILKYLASHFRYVENIGKGYNFSDIRQYGENSQVNIVTGEKADYCINVNGDDWVAIPYSTYFLFGDWKFSNPIDGVLIR